MGKKRKDMTTEELLRYKEYQRKWYKANKEQADKTAYEWYRSRRTDLINQLGACCNHCGESEQIVLDFDHINNDGAADKKKGGSILTKVTKEPQRFQLLCKNCNWKKEYQRRMEKQNESSN